MASPRTGHRSSDSLRDCTTGPFENTALSVPSEPRTEADDHPFANGK